MKTSTKWFIGFLGITVIAFIAVVTNSQLLKGKLVVTTPRGGARCAHEWTRVLSGRYRYDPPPDTGTDRVDLAGVTASQVRDLARMIRTGCDMKVQFISIPENAVFGSTATCETIDLNGAPEEDVLYVDCRFNTPIRGGSHIEQHFLYDSVAFWLQDGAPKLSKTRVWLNDRYEEGYYSPVSSSFFISPWDLRQDWTVNVYTRK